MIEHLKNNKNVIPVKIWPGMTVDNIIREMNKSGVFMSGMLAEAVNTYEQMIKEDSYIFMSLSGALIPAGMS